MTNHVRLLATPSCAHGISRMMQSLGRCYVRYVNITYKRTGTLWEGRYKSFLVGSDIYFCSQSLYRIKPGKSKDGEFLENIHDPTALQWHGRCYY